MAGSKKDDSYSLVAIIACALPLVLFCTSDSGAAPGAGLVLVADGYAPLADADKNFVAAFGKDHNLGSGSAVGFSALDKDSSGRLDAAEFEVAASTADDTAQQVFSLVDLDNDGHLSADEYALLSSPTEQELADAVQKESHTNPAGLVAFLLYSWPMAGLSLLCGEVIGLGFVFRATALEHKRNNQTPEAMVELALLYLIGVFAAAAGPVLAFRFLTPYTLLRVPLVLGCGFALAYLSTAFAKGRGDENTEMQRQGLGEDVLDLVAHFVQKVDVDQEKAREFLRSSVTDTLSLSGVLVLSAGVIRICDSFVPRLSHPMTFTFLLLMFGTATVVLGASVEGQGWGKPGCGRMQSAVHTLAVLTGFVLFACMLTAVLFAVIGAVQSFFLSWL